MNAHAAMCSALGSLLLVGCSREETSTLPPEVTSAFEQAASRADIDACASLFLDGAEIIAEDAPVVRSKQAVREFCQAQFARELNIDSDSALSIVDGDLALEQGTYRIRNVDAGRDVEYGDYINVWRRSGGEWRIFRSMYNMTEGPKPQVTVSEDESGTGATK